MALRDILEITYFICGGPILAGIAGFGLYQLRIGFEQLKATQSALETAQASLTATQETLATTKELAKISAQRDSYKLAADQCFYFASTIAPLSYKFSMALKEKDIVLPKPVVKKDAAGNDTVSFSWDKAITNKVLGVDAKGIQEPATGVMVELVPLINSMEAFALFFISGVADEQVGFSSTGFAYCYQVRELLPLIHLLFNGPHFFPNGKKLYKIWNDRLKLEQYNLQKEALEAKIKDSSGQPISPIGA